MKISFKHLAGIAIAVFILAMATWVVPHTASAGTIDYPTSTPSGIPAVNVNVLGGNAGGAATPIPTPSPTPYATASAGLPGPPASQPVIAHLVCATAAGATPNVTAGNVIAVQCDANGRVIVTTPVPAPTVSPGLVNGAVIIGPSTAPAAINGAYTKVIDSNGRGATRVCDATTSTTCAYLATIGNVDGFGAASISQLTSNQNMLFNGTTWDRLRSAAAPTGLGTGILPTTTSSGTASAPVACDSFAAVNISTATTTSIVAVSGSKAVYICAYHLYVVSGTLPSFQFEYGTGAACVTTQTVMSGTFGGLAGAVGESFVLGSGVGSVLQTPAAKAFCIVSGGTTPNIQGFVTFSQF